MAWFNRYAGNGGSYYAAPQNVETKISKQAV
jgi:hypothetical protein